MSSHPSAGLGSQGRAYLSLAARSGLGCGKGAEEKGTHQRPSSTYSFQTTELANPPTQSRSTDVLTASFHFRASAPRQLQTTRGHEVSDDMKRGGGTWCINNGPFVHTEQARAGPQCAEKYLKGGNVLQDKFSGSGSASSHICLYGMSHSPVRVPESSRRPHTPTAGPPCYFLCTSHLSCDSSVISLEAWFSFFFAFRRIPIGQYFHFRIIS